MKKLLAATLIAFALSTPAVAFDISSVDGIPADMKDMIAKKSGGRITNQGGQQGQQQAGQGGQQQQGGRQARKKQSQQEKAMQSADQFMKGDSSIGQSIPSFR